MSRTEEQQKQAAEIFGSYKAEIDKRELSNTDNYDKSILTLSSAGLAISLTLIKDILPIEPASYLFLLYFAWGFFGLSITTTIISFLISNKALQYQLDVAERYYIFGDENAFNAPNRWLSATMWLNRSSGTFFVSAIASVIIFGMINFSKRNAMSEEVKRVSSNPIKSTVNTDGHQTPYMPKVLMAVNGANVPQMQAMPVSSSVMQKSTNNTQVQTSEVTQKKTTSGK